MKLICYSLFDGKKERFEKLSYIRGFYFNLRMNRLIYPEWATHLHVDKVTYNQYHELFGDLRDFCSIWAETDTPPLCEGMLWRMQPIFVQSPTHSHILCRDSDAITTYREAQAVNDWLNSGKSVHAILDNPAHAGLMGGMIGFKADKIRALFPTWEDFISGQDLSKHGSDQHLLNKKLLPKIQNDIHWSNQPVRSNAKLPGVDPRLWESDLTCRHIGSAGVVEMETLRFFKRFDDDPGWKQIEKNYPEIFYWR